MIILTFTDAWVGRDKGDSYVTVLPYSIYEVPKVDHWCVFFMLLCATTDAEAGKNESNRRVALSAVTNLTDDFAEMVLF